MLKTFCDLDARNTDSVETLLVSRLSYCDKCLPIVFDPTFVSNVQLVAVVPSRSDQECYDIMEARSARKFAGKGGYGT